MSNCTEQKLHLKILECKQTWPAVCRMCTRCCGAFSIHCQISFVRWFLTDPHNDPNRYSGHSPAAPLLSRQHGSAAGGGGCSGRDLYEDGLQVGVRGTAAEGCVQPAGLQLRPARGAGGEDPSLVQHHQLAADGSRAHLPALRAGPPRRICQGDDSTM